MRSTFSLRIRLPLPILAVLLAAGTTAACEDDASPTFADDDRLLTRRLETDNITFYFAEGDTVNAAYQQAFHEWAVPYLGISEPQRLRYFKYLGNAHMTELTGQTYGSWADVEGYAIHSVEMQQGHEAIHCYSRAIGWPTDFFTEGIAVALDLNPYTGEDIEFFGAPVHDLCGTWLEAGTLYRLADMLDEEGFWRGRWTQSYPQAGSFVRFLIAGYGLDRFKEMFSAIDDDDSAAAVLSAFEAVYGIRLEEAELLWHEFLRGGDPPP
jgi:hypothetical protein